MTYQLRSLLILLLAAGVSACQSGTSPSSDDHRTWTAYGGGANHTHYSSLDQITRSNVDQLEVAWTYSTRDEGPTIETNPIVIDSVMYVTSPALKVIALDAATGEEIWRFDPYEEFDTPSFWHHVNRAVTYWTDGSDSRIFAPVGPYVYALDAETGEVISDFGTDGRINLRRGLGRDVSDIRVMLTSPGVVYEDLLIVGPNVPDGTESAPGHVRAFDVRTGEQAWIFHTIPQPGEFGHDTWNDSHAWKRVGGANSWAGMAVDEERGIVYVPTGSATPDFYGARRKGKNLFANCLLALKASTGERLWHYQTVHHDLWDRDLPAPPSLVTVRHDGEQVDAVAQTTKTGYVFLFNRETGEPLYPIEEVPVPTESPLEGEEPWPT